MKIGLLALSPVLFEIVLRAETSVRGDAKWLLHNGGFLGMTRRLEN